MSDFDSQQEKTSEIDGVVIRAQKLRDAHFPDDDAGFAEFLGYSRTWLQTFLRGKYQMDRATQRNLSLLLRGAEAELSQKLTDPPNADIVKFSGSSPLAALIVSDKEMAELLKRRFDAEESQIRAAEKAAEKSTLTPGVAAEPSTVGPSETEVTRLVEEVQKEAAAAKVLTEESKAAKAARKAAKVGATRNRPESGAHAHNDPDTRQTP